jgi:hypothetical protein
MKQCQFKTTTIMHKGFSSKITEELYNYVIAQDLRGEQICELANRLHEYGSDKQWKEKNM